MLVPITLSLCLVFLLFQKRSLKGWTLTATWYWAVTSVTVIGLGELSIGYLTTDSLCVPSWSEELRYVVAVSSFCPSMSQMGARRPQQDAWNFVVLSLWAILVLPAAKPLFLGGELELHGIGGGFAWLLIAINVANMLPTRFWLSALLVGGAQVLLLAPHLPLLGHSFGGHGVSGALSLTTVAAALSWWNLRKPRGQPVSADELWILFRDLYGALWGLRLAEQFNAAARRNQWQLILTWWGFAPVNSLSWEQLPADERAVALQALRNLLRRFAPAQLTTEQTPN